MMREARHRDAIHDRSVGGVGPVRPVRAPVTVDGAQCKVVVDDLAPFPAEKPEGLVRLRGDFAYELHGLVAENERRESPAIAEPGHAEELESDIVADESVLDVPPRGARETMSWPESGRGERR